MVDGPTTRGGGGAFKGGGEAYKREFTVSDMKLFIF